MHTARPLLVDEVENVGSIGLYRFHDGSTGESDYLPQFEGMIRKGMGENFDAGLRMNAGALVQADLNYALIQNDSFALSVDPTIALQPSPIGVASYFWLPILADVYSDETMTVTVSGRWGRLNIDGTGDEDYFDIDQNTSFYGFGLGLRYESASGRIWIPELSALFPLEDEFEEDSMLTFSLGLVF